MPVRKVLLTLARVGFDPGFSKVNPSGYMRTIAQVCLSLTDDSYTSRKRKVKDEALREKDPGPDFPCSGFLAEKEVNRVKGGEVLVGDRYNLDPNAHGLPSPELPLVLRHRYSFGLFSVRISTHVFLSKEMSVDDLIYRWKDLAQAFRARLEEEMPEVPDSWLSNYYSEIYVLEGSIGSLSKEEAEQLISPLKDLPSHSRVFTRREARDPMVVSTDGLLVQLQTPGRRHRDQRRKMRRTIRAAVDIVLGQKVFYTNPTLWRRDACSWSAMVGMIYLNPHLWSSTHIYPSRKFYAAYRRISSPFQELIIRGYSTYSSGYGSFLTGVRVSHIHAILYNMYRLGVELPEVRLPLLTDLEGLVLTMLCMKEALDRQLKGARNYVKKVSEELCKEFNGEESSCITQLQKKISSRKDKRGLSIEELEVLLGGRYSSPRGIIRKHGVMESLLYSRLVRSLGRIPRKGSGPSKVEVYVPEVSQEYVAWLLSLIGRRSLS